jgi:LPXTG-motif cell wall-anchored protein
MRRYLMLVLAVALAALVFAPAAFAQDDDPTGDDVAASPTATSTASATPTASVTPTASATAAAAAQYEKSATVLPDTGGSVPTAMLAIGAGALLVGGGLLARRFMG